MIKPILSIVLGTYNRIHFLKQTILSLRKELLQLNFKSEIIIIDGGSNDGTISWLTRQKDIVFILQHNRGFWNKKLIERKSWGYFMNLGFKCAQGKYILMLSDDCLVVPNSIINGIKTFEESNEKIGSVAFYWREYPLINQYMIGYTLGNNLFVNHGLYLKQAIEDVGYIDEENYSFYHADGDLILKMKQIGYNCIASQNSFIEHFSHANLKVRASNNALQKKDWNTYLNKWKNIYYFEGEDTGGWIYQDFEDKAQTVKQFKYAQRRYFSSHLRNLILFKNIIVKKLTGNVRQFYKKNN